VDELFSRHRQRLRRMVAVRMDERLAARVDPSDVVQETLGMAHAKLPDYLNDPAIAFYPWLRKIAWDQLVSAHRQHLWADMRAVGREESLELSTGSALQLADQLATSKTGPVEHLLREEVRRRTHEILQRLSDIEREILVLKHLEELSNAECAAVLGISVAAAKKRYLRALERVRSSMADDAPP
jgi:RNA polymerase sigma-70 factor (ECF subfamily)